MRILVLGDMVGRGGRNAVINAMPELKKELKTDFVIVNGENAAGGFGISREMLTQTIEAGVDVVTSGNHAFDQKETLLWANEETQFLRPANFPQGTPGKGANIYKTENGQSVLVVNIMGNVFMAPGFDNPFDIVDKELEACSLKENVDAIVIDFHAETTSEKQCMGHFVDGRASLMFGTHTHIPTADNIILPKGTAYQTDVGMCGDYNSSIGMDVEEPLYRFVNKISRGRFEPANGEPTISGVLVITDDKTGLAMSIEPLRINGRLSQTKPNN